MIRWGFVNTSLYAHPPISPETAFAEFERLLAAGDLNAATVVAAAQNEDSPLHDAFAWTDTDAAAMCRLQDAKELIESLYDGGKPVYTAKRKAAAA
jgi:hypothetical protein